MSFNVGSLNRRIEVWHKEEVINELQQKEWKDTLYLKLWAKITPQTGKAFAAQAGTMASEITHKITIRYRKDIKKDMYIVYQGVRFDIKAQPLDPYMEHKILEISVSEVAE